MGLPQVLVGRQRSLEAPCGVWPLVVEMDAAIDRFALVVGLALIQQPSMSEPVDQAAERESSAQPLRSRAMF